MRSRDIIFVAIVLFVVGGLYFLSTRAKTPRPMPVNEPHKESKLREQCMACHKAETLGALEQQHKHPGKWRDEKVTCLQCHQMRDKAVSRNRMFGRSDATRDLQASFRHSQ